MSKSSNRISSQLGVAAVERNSAETTAAGATEAEVRDEVGEDAVGAGADEHGEGQYYELVQDS